MQAPESKMVAVKVLSSVGEPREIKRVVETTPWLNKVLVTTEDTLEFVALPGQQFLAFAGDGYGRRLPLNTRATALFRAAFSAPLKIYGDAVLLQGRSRDL